MSFGAGAGDIIAISTFAWNLYKTCRDSSDEFVRISHEVASLHVVLDETKDYLKEYKGGRGLSPKHVERLEALKTGCQSVLDDLQTLVVKYESLGTQQQRAWDRAKWGLEDLASLRDRIVSNTTLLGAFNSILTSQSIARLEKRLKKYVMEVRGGLREGSQLSASTIVETIDSPDVWSEMRRELEDVGVSDAMLEENHSYIITWLKTAITNGLLEESDPNAPEPAFPEVTYSDSAYGSSGALDSHAPSLDGWALSLASMSSANEEFKNEMQRRPSRAGLVTMMEKASLPPTGEPIKARKASTVSSVIFKLLKKETAIIEAASDGNIEKVAKLISAGANVNARDRWKWSALSMCGYGGFTDIARLLLDHGANIDNVDIDGDTPEDLARNRGHVGMVFLLEEERVKRSMRAVEDDTEVPASLERAMTNLAAADAGRSKLRETVEIRSRRPSAEKSKDSL